MLSQKLFEIRKKRKLSQENLAEIIGVSRQAIQKWESGTSRPDSDNLLQLARALNVSIDTLLGNDNRSIEELRLGRELIPDYHHANQWDTYQSQLHLEYRQSYDEGKDIEKFQGLFAEVQRMAPGSAKEHLSDVLFGLIMDAGQCEDYPYQEPSDLERIRQMSTCTTFEQSLPDEGVLRDRIKGAWLGRICGCLLGKPLEGARTDLFWPKLKATDNFPLHRYLVANDFNERDYEAFRLNSRGKMVADRVACAPVDDDTNYTVLACELIERYGLLFTPANVSEVWVDVQSKNAYCTAERVAYRNFIAGYRPPASAIYKNPYREWIGAQIRGDYYGYINPGDPMTATDMAWRDASISHVKNGIYGEMLVAAMLAFAAICDDVQVVIHNALSYIPSTSRLYERLQSIMTDYLHGVDADECYRGIHARYDEHNEYDWCHTIPNAEIVIASLLYGKGDFGKTICLAVQCGFDTDCNGATVGSVFGMMHGVGSIEERWTAPVRGMLDTSIFGVGKISVDELVDRTLAHIHYKRN